MKKILLLLVFALFCFNFSFAQFNINEPLDLQICDDGNNDGIADFDLTVNDAVVLNGLDPQQYGITYHLTSVDAFNSINPLASPFTNFINPQTIFVSVIEWSTGNIVVSQFDLIVNEIPEPSVFSVYELCDGPLVVDSGLSEANYAFNWYLDGFVLANETNSTLVVNQPGVYSLQVISLLGNCSSFTEFSVQEGTFDNMPIPSAQFVCDDDGDGIAVFDLHPTIDEVQDLLGDYNLMVTFHETQADADSGVNALDPIFTNSQPFGQTLFIRVSLSSQQSNCYGTTIIDLVVDVDCVNAFPVTVNYCSANPNAVIEIDLTTEESTILNGQDPSGFALSYYQSEADAFNEVNAIANPQQYTIPSLDTTLYVRVEDVQSGSFTVVPFFVVFGYEPVASLDETYTICDGNEIVLTPTNDSTQYLYSWNTGSTDPEIVVDAPGIYSVVVTEEVSGCFVELSTEVFLAEAPALATAPDLTNCEPNAVFDLTTNEAIITNGMANVIVTYYNNLNFATAGTNPISTPDNYTAVSSLETIYVRVETVETDCFAISDFDIISDGSCPLAFDCAEGPITNSFCYGNNNQIQYTYESNDGIPLQITFTSGTVENNWDELYIFDSDGVTNINPESTIYGNNGDLTGLVFTSTGNSITIFVDSDGSVSCQSQNFIPIEYEVSCVDPNAIPSCLTDLNEPFNGDSDVNENTSLSWNPAAGVVLGYTLSVGLTAGGTEVIDNEDIGNVLEYELETLDYETTYYVTIVPYNINGPAENCQEFSFITRANPNQVVVCEDGAVNTTHCYGNDETTEFNFQSSDGQELTIVFNAGATEVNYDEVYVIDSDGTILNPDMEYGNSGDFTGLTYTSTGDSITVRFETDFSISCANGSSCCTESFDFDVFCASTVGIIQVNAFVDTNANGINDVDEPGFSNGYFTYELNGDGMINTVNSSTGSFHIISFDETDSYDVTFNLYDESEACYDVTIASFSNVTVATGNNITLDFPVVEDQSCEDLAVYLINNWIPPRPGFSHDNYLYLENLGFTTIASGTVEFVLDSQLILDNTFGVDPAYTVTTTATGFTVDFVNLQPGELQSIGVSITCPPNVALGDIVTNTANYLTDSNDMVADNNDSTLSEVVVGSWDPNDKMEVHGPRVNYNEFSSSDEWLYYTIRFQNLGTAAAEFVRIEDAIDNLLDESTFQMLRSSHDYVVTRTENHLEWYFDDINLPAEQDDVEGSKGFVYFRIQPKPGYAIGDIIPNTGAIYFDFNAPVITNRFETEFVDDALSISEFGINDFEMYPNPARDLVNIKFGSTTDATVSIVDISGKVISQKSFFNTSQFELKVSHLQSGVYFVKLQTHSKTQIKKLIKE
ncbi:T9SS type A sorting domain-containing protein [Psychroserpens sp. XS_ASV72]|uniref:T9SS type A sorting domain-containing protein n=1 Tax=Psychroserpens sp. XS_ASV72 TaxID=3241293 RepID=UPI003513C33A